MEALAEAQQALAWNERPVAAVAVVDEAMVARAHDRVRETTDPTAHAVVVALREASRKLGRERLALDLHDPRTVRDVRRGAARERRRSACLRDAQPGGRSGRHGAPARAASGPSAPHQGRSGIRRDEAERLLAPSGVADPFGILSGGEVSEWLMVPLSKSGLRKQRGFESHPLRQTHRSPEPAGANGRFLCVGGGRLVDYGAALEMRFGATRRGFRSRLHRATTCLRVHARSRRWTRRILAPISRADVPWRNCLKSADRVRDVQVSGSGVGGATGRGGRVRHSASRWRVPVRYRVGLRERRARGDLSPAGATRRGGAGRRRARDRRRDRIANCHLHADHAGQNLAFPACRSTSRPRSGSWPTRPTTRSSSGSISRVRPTSR